MMDIAHGTPFTLQRTQTAPIPASGADRAQFHSANAAHARSAASMNGQYHNNNNAAQSPLVQSQGHTSSNYSIQSQPSSRSSDTTQGTAHSTLFPPPPPLPSNASNVGGMSGGGQPNGGNDVTATDNVMNSVADAESSLFQICVRCRQRLCGVPGFSESLTEEEEDADEDTDPVTLLWRTFRRGYPLMLLYNALRPNQPLSLPAGTREDKQGKIATFKFLQACITDLKFRQEDMFIITDLYTDDTTGFSKVVRVVNRVLDILVQRGIVEDVRPTAADFEQAEKGMKRTQRQHIVSELVTTERTYVQHLELLQAFKHLVEEKGVIPGDAVHDIFLNLNALLDFQRRFLIRVEQTNSQSEDEQNWGKLFVLYCEAFKVYEPYIANQRKCEKTVVAEFSKLAAGLIAPSSGASNEMRQMVESPTALYGFLMKPFQRLSKYPLLLDDLYKKGDLDEDRRNDLLVGKEAATSVLARTNKAVDREEKAEAVQELKLRVEDWKGHRVEGFGELLLYGSFTVLKSENLINGRDGERQYNVFLFETILLCCKDIDLSKPKNKLSNKTLVDKRGKPKLQLKGRIFMQNVTDLISLAKPGSYTCQIFWKGDPSIENFIIRFQTEDLMRKWAQQIEQQRRIYKTRTGRESNGSRNVSGMNASNTEFDFIRQQTGLENPYAKFAQEEDEEEDDVDTLVASSHGSSTAFATYPPARDFSQSRNGSSTSLRSRSTTGESSGMAPVTSGGRTVPPRFAQGSLPAQNLSLRTRELAQSPGPIDQNSYFSPTGESPQGTGTLSSRTSSSSTVYFPPQQMQRFQNGYADEGHTRYTAPVMPRQREPSSGSTNGGYAPANGASAGGAQPSGPARRPGMHSAQNLPGQHRNRSASSPDIHNNPRGPPGAMRGPGAAANGVSQPPVPDMPATYQQNPHMIPRSQSGSPNLTNGMPPQQQQRGMSPQMQRGYTQQPQGMYAGGPPVMRGGPYGGQQQQGSRTTTPVPSGRDAFAAPPHLPTQTSAPPNLAPEPPTQLKVKVLCPSASQTLTLVVPLNISYQSLKDRIDAKLQRSTNLTLGERGPKEHQVRLRYTDEDGDPVSIQSDEDVQGAFEAWADAAGAGPEGGMGEVELSCVR